MSTWQAARNFATTDPKLLRRKTIEASLADKWREVQLPQPLQPLTNAAAQLFGYKSHALSEPPIGDLPARPDTHTPRVRSLF
jgi:hypothetical protein